MTEFDLERLRKNWDRAAEPESLPVPARASRVRAPEDVCAEARSLLRAVKKMGLAEHATHREALVPFLDRAEAALESLASGPEPDPAAREELVTALVDLEDLFDVFGTTARSAC